MKGTATRPRPAITEAKPPASTETGEKKSRRGLWVTLGSLLVGAGFAGGAVAGKIFGLRGEAKTPGDPSPTSQELAKPWAAGDLCNNLAAPGSALDTKISEMLGGTAWCEPLPAGDQNGVKVLDGGKWIVMDGKGGNRELTISVAARYNNGQDLLTSWMSGPDPGVPAMRSALANDGTLRTVSDTHAIIFTFVGRDSDGVPYNLPPQPDGSSPALPVAGVLYSNLANPQPTS
jgi:hypothetical protein